LYCKIDAVVKNGGKMKRLLIGVFIFMLACSFSNAQTANKKVILLISEQNIEGPQRAWWASEIDLSVTEATIAKKLIEQGYEVIEPAELSKTLKKTAAFRMLNLDDQESVKLGKEAKADYIVLGKAIASSGGTVPQSNMRSCFANITVKLIRASDGKIVAYLEGSGNTVHTDVVTGGKEALVNAADDLTIKITDALNKAKNIIN